MLHAMRKYSYKTQTAERDFPCIVYRHHIHLGPYGPFRWSQLGHMRVGNVGVVRPFHYKYRLSTVHLQFDIPHTDELLIYTRAIYTWLGIMRTLIRQQSTYYLPPVLSLLSFCAAVPASCTCLYPSQLLVLEMYLHQSAERKVLLFCRKCPSE